MDCTGSVRVGASGAGPDAGQGLFATAPIAPGGIVLAVPEEQLLRPSHLTAPHAAWDDEQCRAAAELGDLSDEVALALVLVRERCLGPRSPHAAYMNSLPRAYTNAWLAPSLQLLPAGTELAAAAAARKTEVEQQHENFAAIWPLLHASHDSLNLWQWAIATVESRAFKMADGAAVRRFMVPLADIANHSFQPTIARIAHNPAKNCVEFLAGPSGLSAGEEALLSYGPLPNADLLLQYGFSLADNPHDTIVLELDPPEHADQGYVDAKMSFLSLFPEGGLVHRLGRDPAVAAPGLILSLRLLLLTDDEVDTFATWFLGNEDREACIAPLRCDPLGASTLAALPADLDARVTETLRALLCDVLPLRDEEDSGDGGDGGDGGRQQSRRDRDLVQPYLAGRRDILAAWKTLIN